MLPRSLKKASRISKWWQPKNAVYQTQGHIGSPWHHFDDFLSASAGKRWAEQDHTIHLEYACGLLPAKKRQWNMMKAMLPFIFEKIEHTTKNIHFSGVDMATQVNIWHEL